MSERIRVSADQLKNLWFSSDAATLIHDHKTQEVVVVMADGTAYACTFAEKYAAEQDTRP